jgi:3-hydroxyacyl-CoA dehydrogenase
MTYLQKLVELIPALQTSEGTSERAKAFALACGKGEFCLSAEERSRCSSFCGRGYDV